MYAELLWIPAVKRIWNCRMSDDHKRENWTWRVEKDMINCPSLTKTPFYRS